MAKSRTWGYIYIIRSLHRYKIGLSWDLQTLENLIRRLNNMNAFGVKEIMVLHTRRPLSLETELHRLFAAKRVHYEWFELDADDLALIQQKYVKELMRIAS